LDGATGAVLATNLGAGSESGEPRHANHVARHSVWWTWTAPSFAHVRFETYSTDSMPHIAVYQGHNIESLTAVASNVGGGEYGSRLYFDAIEGQVYRVVVDTVGDPEHDCILEWSSH
jgi:hypothetical protein